MGNIADGVYGILENTINILSGPTITYQKLLALNNLLVEEIKNPNPPEIIKEKAGRIDPNLGGLFNPFSWSPEVKNATIGVIGGVIGVIILALTNGSTQTDPQITPVTIVNYIQFRPAEEILGVRSEAIFPKPKIRPSLPSSNRAERRRQRSTQRQRKPQP